MSGDMKQGSAGPESNLFLQYAHRPESDYPEKFAEHLKKCAFCRDLLVRTKRMNFGR